VITVKLVLDGQECLSEIRVTGHAGQGLRGKDPGYGDTLCAAVSVLTRTLLNALHKEAAVSIDKQDEEKGIIQARVVGDKKGRESRISGITGFFITGIFDLKKDFPESLDVILEK